MSILYLTTAMQTIQRTSARFVHIKDENVITNACRLKRFIIRILIYKSVLDYKNLIGGFKMEYQNNYATGKRSAIFSIAVYIKKHFSYKVGNALLNTFC